MAKREGDGVTGWPPGITPAAVDWEAAARRFGNPSCMDYVGVCQPRIRW